MKMPRPLRMVFPLPSRPVHWPAILPLLIFGALFAGTILALEVSHTVMFATPRAFWLSAALVWVWWIAVCGRSGVVGWAARAALMVRLLLVGGIVAVLAEPQAVRTHDETVVVYALDVSDSVGEEVLERALGFVSRTVQGKPPRDKAGLVVFARNAAVELPPRESFPFEAINVRVSRDGTSLERALTLSSAMLPDSSAGRIVLLSDGAQTEGDAAGVLPELTSRGVRVDVLPIAYRYEREVWLERLELPRVVKPGETYEAAVILSSLAPGHGVLTLSENGKDVATQEVQFSEGKSRFVLPLYLRGSGFYEYEARIELPAGEDGWLQNNLAVNHLFLKGEGRVLVVHSASAGEEQTRWLCEAMQASGLLVDLRESFDLPLNALSYLPYDSIVFVNVPADELDAARMQAVHDAVVVQGSGFLMVGGDNSFGAGGYNRTVIEKILPVSMDIKKRKVMPKGALAIILHTCEFAEGNTWGKRIAKEAIRVLSAEDEVGVLVYSYGQGATGERWLFPLTPASEYERLVPLINNASIGDMPSFATTMQLGYDGLIASDAASRHMIIISDGDPSPPPPALLARFANAQISVSTVAINPHGGQEQAIMGQIAHATGGRYYFPKDPRELPSIFIKEAKTLRRNIIQNRTFVPQAAFPSPILKGIEAVPPLHGLVLTMAKPRAESVLVAPDEEEHDPLLAVWRHGLGTTAAFTSDLSANWGRDWVAWERYRPFVRQLMTAIGRVERKQHLFATVHADGAEGRVTVEDHHDHPGFLTLSGEVTRGDGARQTVALRQVGPRRYEGTFPLSGNGRYQLLVAGSGDGRREHVAAGLMVPYSPEYLRFRSDPVLLQRIADETGGRVLVGDESGETLFRADREVRRRTRPIVDWFLWALALLLPLDVAIRRVRIDWRELGRKLTGRRRADTTRTLGSLLARKQDVDRGLDAVHEARAALRVRRPAPPRPAQAPASPGPSPAEREPSEQEAERAAVAPPTSTTGQLLARKRQWKQKDQDHT